MTDLREQLKELHEMSGCVSLDGDAFWDARHELLVRLRNATPAILAALEELRGLRVYLKDTSADMECIESCNSYFHDDLCPHAYAMNAFRKLRERAEAAEKERDQLRKENATFRKLLSDVNEFYSTADGFDSNYRLVANYSGCGKLINQIRDAIRSESKQ